jgi:protein involved in polysaccharide export with SLBB domain
MRIWSRNLAGSTDDQGHSRPAVARVCLLGCVLLLAAAPIVAQGTRITDMPRRAAASRQELDSLVARAEAEAAVPNIPADQSAALQRYVTELRTRLRDGDFQPGDHIVLAVHGDSTLSGTYTVQPSRALVVPQLPAIPLTGVLRSELQPYLATRLRPYVRDTLVRGTPLMRVGVLGEVAHPGYYRVALDQTLGDALMLAGGPTPQSDLTRTTIRRGSATVLGSSAVRDAMTRELPLSELNVDAGDEVIVVAPPPRHERNWTTIVQLVGVATGIFLAVRSLRNP